jgi:hypothetical protein
MRPSIEGLVCTVTPFQLILKNFKRRQHFFDPGASFECFDALISMGAKEKRSLTVLQNSGEMSFFEQGCFGDSQCLTFMLAIVELRRRNVGL